MAIVDLTIALSPTYTNQRGFRGPVERVSAGVYDLTLEQPLSPVGPLTDPTWKLGGMCLMTRRARATYPLNAAPRQWCAGVHPSDATKIRMQFSDNTPTGIDPLCPWSLLVFRFPVTT